MNRIAIFCAGLLLALPVVGMSKDEPQDDSGKAQLVATGDITKIDLKKKTLTLRSLIDVTISRPSAAGGRAGGGNTGGRAGGGRGGRGGTGGGGRGGRGGGNGGGNGGGAPAPSSGTSTGQAHEYKITVTDKTVINEGDMKISLNLLKVGDAVTVSGVPKGGNYKLEASTISKSQSHQ